MLYTVRHQQKVPFTWRVNDRTTVVSFRNVTHASKVAISLESHFFTKKLWPDMTSEHFELVYSNQIANEPYILDVYEHTWDELREYCALWNVGLLVIDDELDVKDESFTFTGSLATFQVPIEGYIRHLDDALEREV